MPELIVLGTAASVPDAQHDTVSLVLRGPDWAVPIDCGGSPLYKMARLGIELDDIRALILTHSHADHTYGIPMLVQGLWLGGRKNPLPIYGPAETLDLVRQVLERYTLIDRAGMMDLEWHPIPRREGYEVLDVGTVRISATPVAHRDKDTRALRFDNRASGRSIVYSADSEPCPALVCLAKDAGILIHEATGEHAGHSSPAQAAEVARDAGVARLVLIHYPVLGVDLEGWLSQAAGFPGPVTLAHDGDVYPL